MCQTTWQLQNTIYDKAKEKLRSAFANYIIAQLSAYFVHIQSLIFFLFFFYEKLQQKLHLSFFSYMTHYNSTFLQFLAVHPVLP